MVRWVCTGCAFTYDEADGIPEMGIEPGTKFEDVPDDWCCPDCGLPKEDFRMYKE